VCEDFKIGGFEHATNVPEQKDILKDAAGQRDAIEFPLVSNSDRDRHNQINHAEMKLGRDGFPGAGTVNPK
jgi:hypothetical protein